MVINNTLTEIGDELQASFQTPVSGVVSLTGLTETINGLTGTRTVDRFFKYTLNGVTWSAWQPLTLANIQAIVFTPNALFGAVYRYVRTGTDTSGVIEIVAVELDGIFTDPVCELPDIQLADFVCQDMEQKMWCLNMTNKCYEPGIVPMFITRATDPDPALVDADYIAFWKTVSCYFAAFVALARFLSRYQYNTDLMYDWLLQSGMWSCRNSPLSDRLYLQTRFYEEISQRGTQMIFRKKGYPMPGGGFKPVDGELLRLVCAQKYSEVHFPIPEPGETGWWPDVSSPNFDTFALWGESANKLWEPQIYPANLSLYPQLNGGAGLSVINDPLAGGDVIVAGGATQSGIGLASLVLGFNDTYAIPVCSDVDYQLCFSIRALGPASAVSIRLRCFNKSGTYLGVGTWCVNFTFVRTDIFYWFSGIAYASGAGPVPVPETTLGTGTSNFRMPAGTALVVPEIESSGGAFPDGWHLFDVHFKPAQTGNPTGFEDSSVIIPATLLNEGNETNLNAENIINRYLIPLESVAMIRWC